MAKGKACCTTRKCGSEPFIFLYVMCFGANISLFPQLVISKVCHQRYNSTVCKNLGTPKFKPQEDVVYALSAAWDTIIFLSVNIPAIFTVLPLCAFAGMISKRKILYLPPVLVILQSILYMFCARYQSMNVVFMALAAGLTSIFGDLSGAIMFASSHMASVTNNDHVRTLRLSILEGCLALGKGFGTLIAGYLLKHLGFQVAFSFSVAASIINILFIAFLVEEPPESNKNELKGEESVTTETSLNICSQFLNNMKESCINIARFARKYFYLDAGKSIGLMLLAVFFEICALFGEDIMLTLYIKHSPLNLSPSEIGLYSFTLHTIRCAGPLLLAYITAKLFRPSDFTVIIIGSVSILATHISMSLSTTKIMLFGFAAFTLTFSCTMGGILSHLTKLVAEDEHGTVLSYVAFTSLISVNVMSFSANKVFMVTAPVFPGATILLFGFLSFIAFMIVLFVFCVVEKSEAYTQIKEQGSQEEKERLPLVKQMATNQTKM